MFFEQTGIISVFYVLGGSTRGTTGSTLKRFRSQSAVGRQSATKQRYIHILYILLRDVTFKKIKFELQSSKFELNLRSDVAM